jgi:hypothetical protein
MMDTYRVRPLTQGDWPYQCPGCAGKIEMREDNKLRHSGACVCGGWVRKIGDGCPDEWRYTPTPWADSYYPKG